MDYQTTVFSIIGIGVFLFILGLITAYNWNDGLAVTLIMGAIVILVVSVPLSFSGNIAVSKLPVTVKIVETPTQIIVATAHENFQFHELKDKELLQAKKFYIQTFRDCWGFDSSTTKLVWEK
jgi:hypothetical protein